MKIQELCLEISYHGFLTNSLSIISIYRYCDAISKRNFQQICLVIECIIWRYLPIEILYTAMVFLFGNGMLAAYTLSWSSLEGIALFTYVWVGGVPKQIQSKSPCRAIL